MIKETLRKWHEPFNTIAQNDKELIPEKITTKNLFILYLIHKLRCISPRELSRLLDQPITHSLVDLANVEKTGLVYSDYTKFYGCKQKVFFTTTEGIEKIAEMLGTEVYTLDRYLDKYVPNFYNQYENKISSSFMPHFLATNDFYLTLLKNNIAVDWKDSRYNALFDGDIRKAPIRVDASYVIGDDFFGIEQDMGTADKTRSLTKFSTYANYFPLSNFDNATIYFSINMGKYLNPKKLNKLPREFAENEEKLKKMRVEKRKYTEARKLVKEYPIPPPKEELEERRQFAELALNNPVISRKGKTDIKEKLAEVNKFLDGNYPKPEDDLELYEQIINNPLVSKSERKKAKIKKEIILTYKEMSEEVNLTEKIKELTLQMRKLSNENNRMKEDREREMLVESACKRRNTVMSYIDFHIKNKESANTLLDLFHQGLNMYMDETILLAEFATKQIRKETLPDCVVRDIGKIIGEIADKAENTIDYNVTKKMKCANLVTTVDYGIEVFKKGTRDIAHIDIFDICSNNIASTYRLYEYLKAKNDEWRFFENRLTICLADSMERIAEIKEKLPHGYSIEGIWFFAKGVRDTGSYSMVCFSEGKIKYIDYGIGLLEFFKRNRLIADYGDV